MRIAALILGILGGIAGIIGGISVLFIGGVGTAFELEGAATLTGLGFAAIPLGILGIVGGALALGKPKAAGIIMLISAVGGVIAISAGYIVAFILLLVGGILALVGQRELKRGISNSVQ